MRIILNEKKRIDGYCNCRECWKDHLKWWIKFYAFSTKKKYTRIRLKRYTYNYEMIITISIYIYFLFLHTSINQDMTSKTKSNKNIPNRTKTEQRKILSIVDRNRHRCIVCVCFVLRESHTHKNEKRVIEWEIAKWIEWERDRDREIDTHSHTCQMNKVRIFQWK